ncbi:MAG: metalloprotease RseP [Caulobacter sp.]|nr:metalloprotease RseP [Caulobacter sp.]
MLGFVQNTAIYALSFVFVLTLVVTVHELGHFLTAKACGVRIDTFSIGFGRALIKWTDKSGVEWRIGWLPFGGYVRFSGDENVASVPDQDDLTTLREHIIEQEGPEAVQGYYHFKPVWQRALIAVAGPMANFALATVLFAILLAAFGEFTLKSRIDKVAPGTPAAAAGFQHGDLITRADNEAITNFDELRRYVTLRASLPIKFLVERQGKTVALTATPATVTINDSIMGRQKVGQLGIAPSYEVADRLQLRTSVWQALPAGAAKTWDVLRTTMFYLGRLVRGQVPADQIGGFIGIVHASGEVAKAGAADAPNAGYMVLGVFVSLLSLSAVLSVSIGFMNLLPMPVLDGGHLLFYAYEAVARRPLAAKVQAVGYRAGLALLVGFMLFAAWNDLHRYDVFKTLGGLFS